ncbi:MmcQ/YjbR family DNA-binding protein [Pontibacter chinhatensis]|uniref:Predicted DNA-binding protein, MmcQ/YjbR family n=1 Tax=Pontibacter chinhatensis TaxID=1436961 RepID=A0A1I2U5V5_9BACT|nr:MmcQ/YjbR family DNA-binding protein [Pontibacter chinhatensis]SFG70011.1 Predicted DNA-binding protein, MmcQ/YjbR family [Pontibacter chinhatensis]
MMIENLQELCKQLPGVTESIKWGHDLCFCVAEKMFLVVGLDKTPTSASFKVDKEEFEEMCNRPGFIPAPYMARYKWVMVDDLNRMQAQEWEQRVRKSYDLIAGKLPKKVRKEIGLEV